MCEGESKGGKKKERDDVTADAARGFTPDYFVVVCVCDVQRHR